MLNPVSYPAAPVSGYGSYPKMSRQQRTAAFYSDPGRVRQYVGKLKEAINNLADQKGGSILKKDCYEAVKRVYRTAINTDQALQNLHGKWASAQAARQAEANGQQYNKADLYGSPHYTWFINATATCVVNAIINQHAGEIFEYNSAKVNQEAIAHGIDYVKRRYARQIAKWYMFYRPTLLEYLRTVQFGQIAGTPGVADAYNIALEALQNNAKSVGAYLKAKNAMAPMRTIQYTPGRGYIGSTPAKFGRTGGLTLSSVPTSTSEPTSSSSSLTTPVSSRT